MQDMPGSIEIEIHACDLCGATQYIEVPHMRDYTGHDPAVICKQCGFIYVKERRSAQAIADSWSNDIFGAGYTAYMPASKARLYYMLESISDTVGINSETTICDIGAGEGEFLLSAKRLYKSKVFGIEPSEKNCEHLKELGLPHYCGTVESTIGNVHPEFDVVTIAWTLEACHDCRAMVSAARKLLKDGGHLVVATGSRVLVPFKKPLWSYFGNQKPDTHPFRFSANSLHALLTTSGFNVKHTNRYIDSDILCMISEKTDSEPQPTHKDDYMQVQDFFERWHKETLHYKEIE